ncbi:MAG: HAD family hydrolase [Candidatus Bathyarchaeales archaeon]
MLGKLWSLRIKMQIKAVLFDLGDTLIRTADIPEIYKRILETYGVKVSTAEVLKAHRANEKDFQQILRKLRLTDWFDVVVGIDTCNKAKPDEEIFLYALDKLHVRPEEALFIGDSVKYDYEGAKKAGLRPLFIDREGKTSKNIETIRSLTEVLLYVQNQ